MPAIRGCYLQHPITNQSGVWVELSTSSPGTLTGMAISGWPSTNGFTFNNYQALINTTYRDYCSLPGQPNHLIFGQQPPNGWYIGSDNKLYPMICSINITLNSISPIAISGVFISEGAIKSFKI